MACVTAGLTTPDSPNVQPCACAARQGPLQRRRCILQGCSACRLGLIHALTGNTLSWAVHSCTKTPQPHVPLCRRHAGRQMLLVAMPLHGMPLPHEDTRLTEARRWAAGSPPDGRVSQERPGFTSQVLQALVSWMHAGFLLSTPHVGLVTQRHKVGPTPVGSAALVRMC